MTLAVLAQRVSCGRTLPVEHPLTIALEGKVCSHARGYQPLRPTNAEKRRSFPYDEVATATDISHWTS